MSSQEKPMKKRDPRAVQMDYFKRGATSLDVDKDPDYVYRGFNDLPNRIYEKIKEGWEVVEREDETDELSKRFSDPGRLGGYAWYQANKGLDDTKGVIMRRLKTEHEKAKAKAQERVDARDRVIHPNKYTEDHQFVSKVKRDFG